MDRDQVEAILDEAHKPGWTATHIGVEETTAKITSSGVGSIEHLRRGGRRAEPRIDLSAGRELLNEISGSAARASCTRRPIRQS
jgi:hypothetical protein